MYQYVVRPGDTLASIAAQYGMSVEFIVSANPTLLNEQLKVGQVIYIPISRYLDEIRFPRSYWGIGRE
jgi:LysM repeat protein